MYSHQILLDVTRKGHYNKAGFFTILYIMPNGKEKGRLIWEIRMEMFYISSPATTDHVTLVAIAQNYYK